MDRSSRGQAFEITLLRGGPRRMQPLRRREPPVLAATGLLRYGAAPDRRAAAVRYLEDVIAPRAIAFCHRLARRLARYR